MNLEPLRLKSIPFAVGLMLCGLGNSVWAAPVSYPPSGITLDATYSLNGGATVNGMTDPSSYISSSSEGADLYLSKTALDSNVFFHTYGFSGGTTYFGARASGAGVFSAFTRSTYSQTFTNNTGSAQNYNFSFDIAQGEVGITGAGAGFAQLLLDIKKNGTTVAKDFTRVEQFTGGGSAACTDNDVGLGNPNPYMSCNSPASGNVFGNGGSFNVSMGTIANGDSFTLDYDIIATVSGDLATQGASYMQACNSGYGGYGGEFGVAGRIGGNDEPADPGQEMCTFNNFFPVNAIARSGDPFNGPQFGLNGNSDRNGANFQMTSTNAVPEPGSLALLGLGLAGLAVLRRRKPG